MGVNYVAKGWSSSCLVLAEVMGAEEATAAIAIDMEIAIEGVVEVVPAMALLCKRDTA